MCSSSSSGWGKLGWLSDALLGVGQPANAIHGESKRVLLYGQYITINDSARGVAPAGSTWGEGINGVMDKRSFTVRASFNVIFSVDLPMTKP